MQPKPKPQPEPKPEPEPKAAPKPESESDDDLGQEVDEMEGELKAAAGQAAAQMRAVLGRGLPFPGTIRSGARFRFRDLFYALRAPLDVRKLLASAAGLFLGSVLFLFLSWLGSLTHTGVVMIIAMVLGGLLYWACTYLGLAVSTRQADCEAEAGGKLPLSEGLGFVKQRWLTVLLTPLLFVGGALVLGALIAVFILIARIPYAGPMVFGLAFLPVFGLAFLAVLVFLMLGLATFTYLPAAEGQGPLGVIRRVWAVVKGRPGWYLAYLLVALAVVAVLGWLLSKIVAHAFGFIALVNGWVGGGEVSQTLLSIPAGLGALLELLAPTGLGSGAGDGWQFTVAGWAVGIGLLVLFALLAGFLLTYFQAAGVAAYRLLTQDEEPGGRA